MPTVTKRVYPTATISTQKKDYVIASTGTVATNGSYNIIDLVFDISNFKAADTCKLVLSLSSATVTNVGVGIDSSKIQKYIQIDSSIKSYTATFGTLGGEKEIDSTGIAYLINNNTLHVYIDARIFSYNGDDPSNMQNLCTINLVANLGSSYIEYSVLEPQISDFTVTGDSIDSDVVCTWVQADVDSWVLQAIQNGVVAVTKTGTTTTTCAITAGELTSGGNTIFKLTATKNTNSIVESKVVNLNYTQVTITSLEPSNVNKLRTNPIAVTFSGENITSWSLQAKQNGIVKYTAAGTTERTSTILANVFDNGTVTLELTVTYSGVAYSNTASRTVTFTAYGKPTKPTLVVQAIYNTPKPLFTWANNLEQVAYKLKINTTTELVLDTGELYGTDSQHYCTTRLENNTDYTVTLNIKNQYGEWSDDEVKSFSTIYSELEPPQFNIYADNNNACIVLTIESNEDVDFAYHEVWRREATETWERVANNVGRIETVKDFECASNIAYEYKITAVSMSDTYSDSLIKSCMCSFADTHISIANTTNSVLLNMDVSDKVTYKDDINFISLDGIEKPKSYSGKINYGVIGINCLVEKDTHDKLKAYKNEPLLLMRDGLGLKMYGRLHNFNAQRFTFETYNVSFTFTETYNEEVNLNVSDESKSYEFVDRNW